MGVFFHVSLRQGTQDVLVYMRDGNDLIYTVLTSLSVIVGFGLFLNVLMDSRSCTRKRIGNQELGSKDSGTNFSLVIFLSFLVNCNFISLIM